MSFSHVWECFFPTVIFLHHDCSYLCEFIELGQRLAERVPGLVKFCNLVQTKQEQNQSFYQTTCFSFCLISVLWDFFCLVAWQTLGPKIVLVRGCENITSKLRQKWYDTAGTNFTKPLTSNIFGPVVPTALVDIAAFAIKQSDQLSTPMFPPVQKTTWTWSHNPTMKLKSKFKYNSWCRFKLWNHRIEPQ